MAAPSSVVRLVLVLVAVSAAACSGDRGNSAKEGLVVDESSRAVPLVKAYDPPPEPPPVELVRWRDGQAEVVQRGVRYAGQWIVDGKLQRAPEPLPMPWPQPVALDEAGPLFVSFGPVPEPYLIQVRVFGEGLDAEGIPSPEAPLAEFECALSGPDGDHCIETRGGHVGVTLRIPAGGVRHITAWATLDVPDRLRRDLGIDSNDVYSAWLFTTRR